MRAAGQAAALAATREQLEQWDVLMGHSASLESENRRLRCADAAKLNTLAKQGASCHTCQPHGNNSLADVLCFVLRCAARIGGAGAPR